MGKWSLREHSRLRRRDDRPKAVPEIRGARSRRARDGADPRGVLEIGGADPRDAEVGGERAGFGETNSATVPGRARVPVLAAAALLVRRYRRERCADPG